jgi:hypothetical protein
MTAKVDGIHAKPIDQALRDAVPVSCVVPTAVDENDRRQAFVSPNDVVKAETLRRVITRLGFGQRSSSF